MLEIKQFEEITQIKMSHEEGGRPLYWVAAYLVDGLLIDTGCKHTSEELVKYLEGANLKLAINTHYHEDHIGANNLIKQKFGIKIFAHRESIPLINTKPELYPYQEIVWGYPEPSAVEDLSEKVKTDHFQFDVMETPGHCKGHVVLVEPNKGWCFSGDIFTTKKPKRVRPEEDLSEIIESIKMVANLKTDRLILFTSIGIIVKKGREALLSCVRYLEELSQRVKLLRKNGLSIDAIVEDAFGGERFWDQFTNGQFSSNNLISKLLMYKGVKKA